MRNLLFVLPIAVILPRVLDDSQAHDSVRSASISSEGAALLAGQPVAFVPNEGQWQNPARYVARFGSMTVFVEETGWTFALEEHDEEAGQIRGVAVRMAFESAAAPEVVAERRLAGHHNYFVGGDETKWRRGVALYGSLLLRGVYPGVDVRLREEDRHLEYDLLIEPGANLDQVVVGVGGASGLRLEEDGGLVIETVLGEVVQPLPRTWEEGPTGRKRPVACSYVLLGEDRFGFTAPDRNPDRALVVDPGLVYSTFFGGSGYDEPIALALDASGGAVVTGDTTSIDFPATPGAYDLTYSCCSPGFVDAFVTRFDASGSSLIYSTFLGGADNDYGEDVAVDSTGAATVVGHTASSNFPTTPGAFDTSWSDWEGFVTRLDPSGSSLVYSTFLGGAAADFVEAVAVDAAGAATVTGFTQSLDFPTTPGAFDTSGGGGFVTRLDASGTSLIYSTFLGDGVELTGLALDASGAATVVGTTFLPGFPTTPGAFDTSFGGIRDGVVARLDPSGASLVYSTYLGGTGDDHAEAVVLDATGGAVVTGWTDSGAFPTTPGAFDTSQNGNEDAFVTRFDPAGAGLVYSTFVGGASDDFAYAVGVDASGAAVVVGSTRSSDLPTTAGAFDTSYGAGEDAFVTRLSPSGADLTYSTYLGSAVFNDWAMDLAVDAAGAAVVTGRATSGDFPTTPGAYDTTFGGLEDGFLSKLELFPTGVSAYGTSTPGCAGPQSIGVLSWPQVGNPAFAITCDNAPPSASGFLGVSLVGLTAPLATFGIEAWIDPTALLLLFMPTSDAAGHAHVPVPVPATAGLAGAQVYTQFVWPDACGPAGWSASNALAITLQP